MSGAQPKAAVVAGMVGVIAEINPKAVEVRHGQKWVDEVYTSLDELIPRILKASANKEAVSLAYQGNIVDLWERLVTENIHVIWGATKPPFTTPLPVVTILLASVLMSRTG
jgi:urocanate hydratase